jgi:hypothetical protein
MNGLVKFVSFDERSHPGVGTTAQSKLSSEDTFYNAKDRF